MPLSTHPQAPQPVGPIGSRFRPRLAGLSVSPGRIDLFIYLLILAFGILHVWFSLRASDFLRDDVFYADCARSLIDHGFYGINGHPETNQPPGLSAFLAMLCILGGCGYTIFLRAMAVFEILGLIVTYELLRREVPRTIAAAICLLLISSEVYFSAATRFVIPSYPYLLASMCALLVARKLEQAPRFASRILWGALLTMFIAASLMFASVGVALLGAILATTCVLLFRDRPLALTRLKIYLPVLLLGVIVQGFWMERKPAPLEWPLPGYPRPYVSQLKVKYGNYPELGMATPADIGIRVLRNASDHSSLLSRILFKRWIGDAWMSILILGPLLLVVLGWCYSVWLTGGSLLDWYFAGYELIYLLWPWGLERRFFLPIAPLACLYLWQGRNALFVLAREKPRPVGLVWLQPAVLLTITTWFWMRGSSLTSHLLHAGLQDETSLALWLLSAFLAAWMVLARRSWLASLSAFSQWYAKRIEALETSPRTISQVLGIIVVTCLIGIGLKEELQVGHANRDSGSPQNRIPPDVEAGSWIRDHTRDDAVVMARHVPTTFHYSQRRVVWFPPSSNPQLLMEGIKKYGIAFVVVVKRENSYYLPTDEDCFAALLAAYPGAFRLVHEGLNFSVFQVASNHEASSQSP